MDKLRLREGDSPITMQDVEQPRAVTPQGFLLGVSAVLPPSPVVRHVRHRKALFVKLEAFFPWES